MNLLTIGNLMHILDTAIVCFAIYKMLNFVSGTKAVSIFVGILIIIFIKIASWYLDLSTVSWSMDQIINWGPIALVVIFQQEIRRGLEELGKKTVLKKKKEANSAQKALIDALDMSLQYMSKRRIGALIVLEKENNLEEYTETGIKLDADVTGQLLINIFIPNTPLHDGAVIIQKDRIAVAAAYLPLSQSMTIPKELGTRHRAGVGVSEVSDAIAIIVSEETGEISVATGGELMRGMSQDTYLNFFEKQLIDNTDSSNNTWFKYRLSRFQKNSSSDGERDL